MGLVFIPGPTAVSILANISKTRSMDSASTIGPMADNIKAIGLMENSMALVSISMVSKEAPSNSASGKMVNVLSGLINRLPRIYWMGSRIIDSCLGK